MLNQTKTKTVAKILASKSVVCFQIFYTFFYCIWVHVMQNKLHRETKSSYRVIADAVSVSIIVGLDVFMAPCVL